jgi:putative transposase
MCRRGIQAGGELLIVGMCQLPYCVARKGATLSPVSAIYTHGLWPSEPEWLRLSVEKIYAHPPEGAGRLSEDERMKKFDSLSHVRWDCKYHVVFMPKYRRKVIYGKLRSAIGLILRDLCEQKEVELLEGHTMLDHIQLCLKIPPKHSVSNTVAFIKGKSAVRVHRELLNERRMTGLHFRTSGYWVSTVDRDEETVLRYVWEQEGWDQGQSQLFE